MKRSFETSFESNKSEQNDETESQENMIPPHLSVKKIHFNNSSESSSSSSSSSESEKNDEREQNDESGQNKESGEVSESEENDEIEESEQNFTNFYPNCLERQIVQKTLAVITRARPEDWNENLPVPDEYTSTMILREKAVFYDEDNYIPFDVTIELRYDVRKSQTSCRIHYTNENDKKTNILYVFWNSKSSTEDFTFNITVEKDDSESRYFFFSRKVMKRFDFNSNSDEYLPWCDVSNVREHIYKN